MRLQRRFSFLHFAFLAGEKMCGSIEIKQFQCNLVKKLKTPSHNRPTEHDLSFSAVLFFFLQQQKPHPTFKGFFWMLGGGHRTKENEWKVREIRDGDFTMRRNKDMVWENRNFEVKISHKPHVHLPISVWKFIGHPPGVWQNSFYLWLLCCDP